MSGVAGVWNVDGHPVEPSLLQALSATLAHRGPDGEALWLDGAIGLSCRLLRVTPEARAEVQPLADASGNVLVFDGRLDNREELRSSLADTPGLDATAPDPALVLAGYRTFGEGVAERLAGDFALGLFDSRRQRLLLARDALGVRPLYWTRVGHAVAFASEIKALLAHPGVRARPNDDLLANMLLNGGPDARGGTLFQDIFAVLPSYVAVFERHGFTARRYWDFDLAREVRLARFDDYVDAFREHFRRAVRRRLRSARPVAISVSGGLDSSSILCCALALARGDATVPPIAGVSFTFPDGGTADEKRFLVDIERAHGVTIERVPAADAGVLADAAEAVWQTETPLLDEQWATNARVFRAARALGVRTILGGQWGDQMLCSRAYLVDFALAGRWREVRRHLREVPRWFMDAEPGQFSRGFLTDLVKEVTPRAWHPALRRIRRQPRMPWYTRALSARAQWNAPKRVAQEPRAGSAHARSIYEQARSSYHVRCMEWDNKAGAAHGLELAFPFLDRDLLCFLMSIPGGLHARGGVPKALLRDAMRPELPPAIAERRWKADFSRVVNDGLRSEAPALEDFFGADGMAAHLGYVDGDVLRAQLGGLTGRLRGPSCEIAWSVSAVVGLETWLRVFLTASASGATP